MAHFLPPELVRQVNKLEWPKVVMTDFSDTLRKYIRHIVLSTLDKDD